MDRESQIQKTTEYFDIYRIIFPGLISQPLYFLYERLLGALEEKGFLRK